MAQHILPNAMLGILGGGQLGRSGEAAGGSVVERRRAQVELARDVGQGRGAV